VAGLFLSLWVSGCGKDKNVGKKPNIFLISVDTLRADHLGCYGYFRNTSPNIDQFASESLLFRKCLSHSPNTCSSFTSILSGFLPHETTVIKDRLVPKDLKMLPEILQEMGYDTIAVISNFVLRKGRGYEQGFRIYDVDMQDRERVRKWPERIAEHATDRAIDFLTQFHKKPMFMWLHYQDPHGPYAPPERFAEFFENPNQEPRNLKFNTTVSGWRGIPSYQVLGPERNFYYYVSQYDREIRYMDEQFKRFIETLKKLGLYDNSLIIFTSDHGEGMGEHNYFFAHGENLYNSLTHVPLIIKYGKRLTGKRTDYVQHIDILPTIFNVLDMKLDSRFRGGDLRQQEKTPRGIVAEMQSRVKDTPTASIVVDGLKLIKVALREEPYQQYQLYDLRRDPNEKENLIKATEYRERLEDLKTRLERISKEDFLKLTSITTAPQLTPEEKEKLKSLGYVQ
jgi:arylsulfatase